MRKFESIQVGPLSVNCSILWDAEIGNAVLVDPGEDVFCIQKRMDGLGVTLQAILLTHAHFDHFGAVAALQDRWKCPAYLHPADLPLLNECDMQTGLFGFGKVRKPLVEPLEHGQTLFDLKVIHTPGHSPGGCCFLGEFESGQVLFAGDTLFNGGVGRTDLEGGSWKALEQSIRKHLYVLDGSTRVVPGHGPCTSISAEVAGNRYVRP